MWSTVSVLAFYLAGLNALMARYAGSCTQGDADRLWGVVFSIAFYALALFALSRARARRAVLLLCAPLSVILVWQLVFAIRLTLGALSGAAACDVLEGLAAFPPSGEEAFPLSGNEMEFAALWLIMATLTPLGALVAARRRR